MRYRDRLKSVLTRDEHRLFKTLNSPAKIQNFLDTLPVNFELNGETYMSVRRALKSRSAHCFEGVLIAAAALAYHGQRPLLMDFRTTPEDEDHVVALYKKGGRWGAISKTNHAVLRYRDPVYKTVRELAVSFFHEYFMVHNGKKTLRAYSRPFSLAAYAPTQWITADEDLIGIVNDLDDSKHVQIVNTSAYADMRKADRIQISAFALTEWPDPRPSKKDYRKSAR